MDIYRDSDSAYLWSLINKPRCWGLAQKKMFINNLRSTAVYSGYLKPCLLWVVQTISGRLVYLGWIDVAPGAEALAWHSVAVSSGPGLARHPIVTFGLSCLFVQRVWLAGWLAGRRHFLLFIARTTLTHRLWKSCLLFDFTAASLLLRSTHRKYTSASGLKLSCLAACWGC